VNPVVLGMILVFAGLFAILYIAAGISLRRDHRGMGELERWAVRNGWSFSRDAKRT
jgi:hypothetical protein